MARVRLRNLRKTFNATEVLKGIDLDVDDHEFAVIVGPSGCGKSTLLRLIAGLEETTAGDLWIDDDRINNVPPPKRGIAMVFQNYALYPHMTVAENMGFSLRLAGVARVERDMKIREVASILQIESLLGRKPGELSGGQRQRVAIGRAIVRNPRLFLFDEPLSNLDAALRVQMRLEILRLREALGSTMIYVTHDQVEAMTMADKIAILQGGVIEQVGAPLDLYHHPRNMFVAGFIGSPRMNFLPGSVSIVRDAVVTVNLDGGTALDLTVPAGRLQRGEKISLGIRPERLIPHDSGQLRGRILAVEHLGSTSFLHVRAEGGAMLITEVDAGNAARVHDSISLQVDENACHLFNEDGEAIPQC